MWCGGTSKVSLPAVGTGTVLDGALDAAKIDLPDLPCDGAADAEAVYAQFEALVEKLRLAKAQVYAALEPCVPEAKIELPRAHPAMFEPQGPRDGAQEERCALLAAEEGAATMRQAGGDGLAQARGAAWRLSESARETAMAALASLTAALCVALLPLGVAGPLLSGVLAVCLNWAATRRMWRARCMGYFVVVEANHQKSIDLIHCALDLARERVAGVVARVEGILDRLIDEQRPTLAHLREHEAALRLARPDFDAPTPEDLKRPLEVVKGLIDGFVDDAKAAVPETMREHVASRLVGRLATERPLFERWAVRVPLYIVLAINLAGAVAQWAALLPPARSFTEGDAAPHEPPADRALGGVSVPDLEHLWAVTLPALTQIALALAQRAVAVALSAAPKVCGLVNDVIGAGEDRINDEANAKIREVVRQIVATGLSGVKAAADDFFPKFEECMQHLRPVLENSAKVAALAQGRPF